MIILLALLFLCGCESHVKEGMIVFDQDMQANVEYNFVCNPIEGGEECEVK
jgi:hypothetical protein